MQCTFGKSVARRSVAHGAKSHKALPCRERVAGGRDRPGQTEAQTWEAKSKGLGNLARGVVLLRGCSK